MRTRVALALLFALILASRLCHAGIAWVEEAYPAAAAIQIFHGKTLYRDFWFDKPPLSPLLYLLWGAHLGVPLRIAGALFVFACSIAAFRFATDLWSEREGLTAAWLVGFFLTFGIPAAVMALAPDLIMVLPHVIAVWLAWRGRAFWSGAVAGIAFLANPKGVFVLAACALWQSRRWPALMAGFIVPNVIALTWMAANGSLRDYWQQVWMWGRLYSSNTFLSYPFREGVLRTLAWAGFQATLVVSALWWWIRGTNNERARFALWTALALISVWFGLRFFPRYYFALLPPFALAAARGYAIAGRGRILILALLLIPLLRFGPRYITLAEHPAEDWADIALNLDSRAASKIVLSHASPSDTLLVWGYRPDIFAYTRLQAGSPFLDSQPLTGVIADRHLTQATVVDPALAAHNRQQLTRTQPTFIVDGLGPLNPPLSITKYSDLHDWLKHYREIGRTKAAIVLKHQ
jgi:hypothetical protein